MFALAPILCVSLCACVSFYRPDVGYVQGMSYLAGNLLLYMAPYDAFVAFAHLLNSPFLHVFLKLETAKMAARYKIYEDLLAECEPDLSRHLNAEGVSPQLYLMEWCMTVFCKRLKLDVVGRVWDLYLLSGESVVYRAAVGVMRALKPQIAFAPFDRIMKTLNAVPIDVGEEELMRAMQDVQLSAALKQRLRAINPFIKDE